MTSEDKKDCCQRCGDDFRMIELRPGCIGIPIRLFDGPGRFLYQR